MAWEVLTYSEPLTQKQIDDYGLRAAPGNPNHTTPAPRQLIEQEIAVGRWEKANNIPDESRLTEWHEHGDFSFIVRKDHITPAQIAERYQSIKYGKPLDPAKEKKPSIKQQIKEAADRVTAKDSSIAKNKEKINGRNLNLER